jgi:CRP-like cAMP-binding protein/di/tricarboxylate transporter
VPADANANVEPNDALRLGHIDLLARIDVFADLDRVELARLAGSLDTRRLDDGRVLFHEGDAGDGLYVVSRGAVTIYTGGDDSGSQRQLAVLQRGQYFGEIALVVDQPRTASVRALGDAELLYLERKHFIDLIARNPAVALAVVAKVVGHLRAADRARTAGVTATGEPTSAGAQRVPGLAPELRTPSAAQLRNASGRRPLVGVALTAALVLAALVGLFDGLAPMWLFLILLGAAAVLWASNVVMSSAVGLSLLVAWMLFHIATPQQATAGFASPSWLFILAIFGLTAAVARSGLLFRFGLLMVRHLPAGLLWQSGGLLLTGAALGAVLPSSTGRASMMSSLALAVSQALRQRDRAPGAAVLGMAAWIGAGPMLFVFLNASSINLLAWGLLPPGSRARLDWPHWFLWVLPLMLVVALGSVPLLVVTLRPTLDHAPSTQRLGLQLAVLGRLQRREWLMVGILAGTFAGWLLGPMVGVSPTEVAALALCGAVISGNLDEQALRELNWNALLFFGVVLSMAEVSTSLGVDHLAADALGAQLARSGISAPVFVILAAGLVALLRLVLLPEQAILLLGLALLPVAAALGIEPGLVVVAMVSTALMWYVPTQSPEYMVAFVGSDGKLFSHAQARRVALGFTVLVLVGLGVSVAYWRLLGLL